MDLREAYRVLEVEVGANEEAVREARRTLAKVWHPDRHANDPALANKAQQKIADVNAAYERIREAKFPSTIPTATKPTASAPAPAPPAATPPPPVASQIDFVARRRVRGWVILLLVAAIGVGTYLAIVKLGSRVEPVAVAPPNPPPPSPPPPSADASSPMVVTSDASVVIGDKTFGLGATKDEVRAAQGEPTEILDLLQMWHYGFANLTFDHDRVIGYWNMDGTLHVALQPHDPAVAARAKAAGHFALGATKDDVIGIEGTPRRVDHVIDETWYYGAGSSISFDDEGRVTSYRDFYRKLHVRH